MVGIGLAILASIVIAGLAAAEAIEATDADRGGKLAFSRIRGQTGDIYVVNGDGSGLRNLTQSRADDADPSWSPDGRRVALRRSPADRFADGDIYLMNADGTGQRRLTRTPADDWEPAWSPDGRRIAFMGRGGGNAEIYVMNADGSAPRLATKSGFLPQWSPNGQKIAFLRRERVAPQSLVRCGLYVMNADGSKQRRVARRVDPPSIFSWSPDGRRIAFASAVGGGSPSTRPKNQIQVVSANGGRLRSLTPRGRWDWGPTWSPDGHRIAFWSGNNDDPDRDPGEPIDAVIRVMNADGSRARRLTAKGSISLVPAWSSDGKQIAFLRGSVDRTLWVMHADGSNQRKLSAQVEPQTELVWQPQSGSMALDMAQSACPTP